MGSAISDLVGHATLNESQDRFLTYYERQEKKARSAKQIVLARRNRVVFQPNNKVVGQGWKTMTVLANGIMMDVQSINKLYGLFLQADRDRSNSVDSEEFLAFLSLDNNAFNKKLFTLFDMDGSNQVDFLEFTCAIWNLCTWPPEQLGDLMFYLYDSDGSGSLDYDECERMIEDVFEHAEAETEKKLIMEALKLIAERGTFRHELKVTEEAFVQWTKRRSEVVHPLKCAYILVRNRILGNDYWEHIGMRAREDVMNNLRILIRSTLGDAGSMEAIEAVLVEVNRKRIRDQVRNKAKDHEADGKLNNHFALTEDMNNHAPGLLKSCSEAQDRKNAVALFHKMRLKRYQAWFSALTEIKGRGDPLTVLLRFSNRRFLNELRMDFEKEWAKAMSILQARIYDRDTRTNALTAQKQPKTKLYFTRKNPRHLPADGWKILRDSQYSCANGKSTWCEQRFERRAQFRKAMRKTAAIQRIVVEDDLYQKDDDDDDDQDDDDDDLATDQDDVEQHEDDFDASTMMREGNAFLLSPTRFPQSSRKNARANKYLFENVKHPDEEWRQKTIDRLKRIRDKIPPEPGSKPLRAPRSRALNQTALIKLRAANES